MLRPLSSQITIDEVEIQAAKVRTEKDFLVHATDCLTKFTDSLLQFHMQWMPIDELLEQPFYEEDHMSRKVYELCVASFQKRYKGLTAHLLPSKFDGTSTYLYFGNAANNDGEIGVY